MSGHDEIIRGLVKPLVWELVSDRDPDFPKWTATGATGKTYAVFKAWWGAQYKWGYVCEDGFRHTPEEAKGSDDADYRARIAAALHVEKIAGLVDLASDFSAAKIDALRYSPPYGASPEDEPDPVVDAETVWAWQADAKAALTTGEG